MGTCAELGGCSLLRARLHTGRRHQVRRHLDHLRHQVIGDTRYGKGRINRAQREAYGLPRMVLHAERILLAAPDGGEPLTIRAPLAPDLRAYLRRLPGVDPGLLAGL